MTTKLSPVKPPAVRPPAASSLTDTGAATKTAVYPLPISTETPPLYPLLVCIHYWILETPQGPTSKGVCKFCQAEKEFDNIWPGDKEMNKTKGRIGGLISATRRKGGINSGKTRRANKYFYRR